MMARQGLVLSALVLAVAAALPAQAQYYRWTDERGNPHYTEGLDSIPERYRSTAVPLELRRSPDSPPASETPGATSQPGTTAPAGTGSTTIRYTPGQPILVDVSINGRGRARLVLEREADVTRINPGVLASAGVGIPRADGTRRVTLDSLSVGEARVDRMPVVAQDGRPGEDGLLGRDFLDRFTVTNDPAGGVLTLTPK